MRDEVVLRIGIAGGQEADARKVLSEAARGCVALFKGFGESWQRAIGAPVAAKPAVVVKGKVKATAVKGATAAKKPGGTVG